MGQQIQRAFIICPHSYALIQRGRSFYIMRQDGRLAAKGGVMQINFYPVFLDSGFAEVLSGSGIMEYGEKIEEEFIKDPSNPQKRSAWNKVQDQLQNLARPSFRRIADHIDHAVEIAGIEHVGLGSDFDGIEVTPAGLENISLMPVLLNELSSRGYSESEIEMIAGENFFRAMNACARA